MRYVCPEDVEKMLLQRTRTVYWKKWTSKYNYGELKGGVLLELALALLRQKTKRDWTGKHRYVCPKDVKEMLLQQTSKVYWIVDNKACV